MPSVKDILSRFENLGNQNSNPSLKPTTPSRPVSSAAGTKRTQDAAPAKTTAATTKKDAAPVTTATPVKASSAKEAPAPAAAVVKKEETSSVAPAPSAKRETTTPATATTTVAAENNVQQKLAPKKSAGLDLNALEQSVTKLEKLAPLLERYLQADGKLTADSMDEAEMDRVEHLCARLESLADRLGL